MRLRYFILVIALCVFGAALSAKPVLKSEPVVIGEAPKKLVFLDFYNEANDKNLQYLSQSIGNAVDTAIKDKYRYDRIPESAWKKYARDNNWTDKDFYDRAKVRAM